MAASVEPRQFGRLEPVSAPPVRTASNGIRRRADSPVRGCGFPALISPPRKARVYEHTSDDEDDEQEDWRELYGSLLQFEVEPSVRDARDEGTADAWIERNSSLIRLTGKHPLNCEPPLARLMHHGFITPAPLHYVRNHGAVPRGDWSTWMVEVTGLVRRPARFTMDELANEFPDARRWPATASGGIWRRVAAGRGPGLGDAGRAPRLLLLLLQRVVAGRARSSSQV